MLLNPLLNCVQERGCPGAEHRPGSRLTGSLQGHFNTLRAELPLGGVGHTARRVGPGGREQASFAQLLERWDASPPIIWTGYGPDEVRRLIDYWRPLERAAGQRLDAGRSPADTAGATSVLPRDRWMTYAHGWLQLWGRPVRGDRAASRRQLLPLQALSAPQWSGGVGERAPRAGHVPDRLRARPACACGSRPAAARSGSAATVAPRSSAAIPITRTRSASGWGRSTAIPGVRPSVSQFVGIRRAVGADPRRRVAPPS